MENNKTENRKTDTKELDLDLLDKVAGGEQFVQRKYTCRYCSAELENTADLNDHMKKVHPGKH